MEKELLQKILNELQAMNKRLRYIEEYTENTAGAAADIKAEVDEIRIAYEAKNFPDKKAG